MLTVLAVLQRVERTGERGLQVSPDGVDLLELEQVARLEISDNPVQVQAARTGHRREAAQAITAHKRSWHQADHLPLARWPWR